MVGKWWENGGKMVGKWWENGDLTKEMEKKRRMEIMLAKFS